jgi:hypothetical protein
MKFPSRMRTYPIIVVGILAGSLLLGEERKPIEFQGRVSAVDLAARTISVRTRTKEFVFQIDIQRCKITKDGHYPDQPGARPQVLESAQVDDYVVGTLALDGPSPVVTKLYLTTKPEVGARIETKHGFITSPYHSTRPSSDTAVEHKAIDVRG